MMVISKETAEELLGMIEELENDREFFSTKYEDMVKEAKAKDAKLAKLERENRMLKDRTNESDNMLRLVLAKLNKLSETLETFTTIKDGNKIMSKIERLASERKKMEKPTALDDLSTADNSSTVSIPKSGIDKLKEDLKTTYGDLDELV